MTGERNDPDGRRLPTGHLRIAAGTVALLVAGLHLFHPQHGLDRLVFVLAADPGLVLTHPRPAAFVLSAAAIVAGVYLVVFDAFRREIYLLGIVLMATYIAGYAVWHLFGHGGFLPGRPAHYHGLAPHEVVVSHLRGDAWARTAKLAEATLLALLVVLYSRES